ncbi:MAG: hypothetical protein R2754_03370 [Microthrixaceae bacterium]
MKRRQLALALVAALVAPAWAGAPAGAAPAAPCQGSGGTRVSVVVDYGTVSGNSSPSAACITITSTMNGAQFLAARAQALGTPPPTYAPSGLLCSIDGYPSGGCGTRTGGKYLYWSYWNGQSGRWVYSSQGPASRRMTANSVEGWRFVNGSGGPSDPAPRIAPNRTAICPAPKPTPTQAPATTPRTAAPAPRPAAPNQAAVAPATQGAANAPAPTPGASPAAQQPGTAGAAPADSATGSATPSAQRAPAGSGGNSTATGSSTTTTSGKAGTTTTSASATTTTAAKRTSTTAKGPDGGPTTLADGERASVSNVMAAGQVPGEKTSGSGGTTWWMWALVVAGTGAAIAGARRIRRRRVG